MLKQSHAIIMCLLILSAHSTRQNLWNEEKTE